MPRLRLGSRIRSRSRFSYWSNNNNSNNKTVPKNDANKSNKKKNGFRRK